MNAVLDRNSILGGGNSLHEGLEAGNVPCEREWHSGARGCVASAAIRPGRPSPAFLSLEISSFLEDWLLNQLGLFHHRFAFSSCQEIKDFYKWPV